ncbi:PREDICTED: putative golgin subfamily A member 6B [Cercocebus atys]|uniref:putative golgin subfamily A member 6B n=1 Tax=Cercocebus atys TaxID=9531 RepID=UPI0005F432E0|nr:PREDICTED: putative golgin subfamily A member 6B [Cercocebus atys]
MGSCGAIGGAPVSEPCPLAGDYITIYESHGAVPNTRHPEDIIKLAQKEEEMKNSAEEPAPGAPAPQELGAAEEQGDLCEVSLADSVEPAAGEAREGSPRGNPTAEKIVQLLPVMQDTQEHPGLASKPCVPFFYRAAENREINIIII